MNHARLQTIAPQQKRKPTILIMAGGTGGHIFPAQAVATLLAADGYEIHWLGTADKMEARLVPSFGFTFHSIQVRGIRGKGWRDVLTAPWMLLQSFLQAKRLLRQVQPALVLGFGGYASGPGGLAAAAAKIPLLIHEQNAVAGTTNRLLARVATKVLVAFPSAFAERADRICLGNPVRAALISCKEQNNLSKGLNILVVGGSLGAKVFNQLLPAQLQQVAALGPVHVRHQTGTSMAAEVQANYTRLAANTPQLQVDVSAFIDDMAANFAWADVVICRAGALTVSEVACAGVAAVFVPLPSAIDDHQTANAQYLSTQGAAVLLPQPQFERGELVPFLTRWLNDRQALIQMATKARALAVDDAAQRVQAICQEIIRSSHAESNPA